MFNLTWFTLPDPSPTLDVLVGVRLYLREQRPELTGDSAISSILVAWEKKNVNKNNEKVCLITFGEMGLKGVLLRSEMDWEGRIIVILDIPEPLQ